MEKDWRVYLFLIAFCCLFLGCFSNEKSSNSNIKPAEEPSIGGTYRTAFADSFLVFDPAKIKDSNSHEVARQIFDGLVELNPAGEIVPSIAKSWIISPDKLTYQFKLREDCKFHEFSNGQKTKNGGRAVVAQDVLYSFKRLLAPSKDSQGSFFWVIKGAEEFSKQQKREIGGINIIASDTVEFTLKKPFSPFLSLLAMCNAFIVPFEDFESSKTDQPIKPVGTGPFIWHDKQEDAIILVANQKHFRGRPKLDRLEFHIIKNDLDRFQAFKDGKLEHVDVPDPVYKDVKQDAKLSKNLIEINLLGINYLAFNTRQSPFDKPKVRQAINYAIDRKAMVEIILNGRAKSAKGILPPGIFAYNPEYTGYDYNLQKAKKLLAEAGFSDGKGFPVITLQINNEMNHVRVSEFVMANLKDLGIKCSLKKLDFAHHLGSIENKEARFFRMGWTVDYPDPDNILYTLFHSSNIENGYNFSGFSNKEVDELLEKARFSVEKEERAKLYHQAEQIIISEAPWVFMYFNTTHILHQPNVKNIELGIMGTPLIPYRNIWLNKPKANANFMSH